MTQIMLRKLISPRHKCSIRHAGGLVQTGISATSIWRSNVLFLADFLAGCLNPTASSIVQGNPKRQVFVNTFALYGQDGWQITKKINFNYGLRYDYEGPVHSAYPTYRSLTRRARQAFQWQGRGSQTSIKNSGVA